MEVFAYQRHRLFRIHHDDVSIAANLQDALFRITSKHLGRIGTAYFDQLVEGDDAAVDANHQQPKPFLQAGYTVDRDAEIWDFSIGQGIIL